MKRSVYGILSMLTLAMIVIVPTAHAQSRLVANVPFDFSLNQKSMAAGEYQVQAISSQVAALRNMDSGSTQFFLKSMYVKAAKSKHACMVFDKYGDQYFLRQVWDGNSDTGIQLAQSAREQTLRLAHNKFSDGPEIVTVAMN